MKVTLKILLAAAVVVLCYMCYRSVRTPMEYDDEKEARDNAIIARLVEIRKAQIEYKNVYKTHAGSFDDLEKFLNTDTCAPRPSRLPKACAMAMPLPTTTTSISFEGRCKKMSRTYPPTT